MNRLDDSVAEHAKHLAAIAALAQETRRPLDEVKEVYEVELARLRIEARITDYVPLFASRSTKARLAQSELRSADDETSR